MYWFLYLKIYCWWKFCRCFTSRILILNDAGTRCHRSEDHDIEEAYPDLRATRPHGTRADVFEGTCGGWVSWRWAAEIVSVVCFRANREPIEYIPLSWKAWFTRAGCRGRQDFRNTAYWPCECKALGGTWPIDFGSRRGGRGAKSKPLVEDWGYLVWIVTRLDQGFFHSQAHTFRSSTQVRTILKGPYASLGQGFRYLPDDENFGWWHRHKGG